MRVEGIWRFPVKSFQGETVESVEIGTAGIEGDRHWAIRDLATGLTLTARREPDLLMAAAHYDGGRVVITLPDGSVVSHDADLSAWLGRDVALIEAGEGSTHAEALVDNLDEGGEWYAWEGPTGRFHDSTQAAVSVVSTATLGRHDRRRFRINLVVDADGEDDLVGQTITIGTAQLEVRKQLSRCVMVTRPQPGLERDIEVLKSVNRDRGGVLGIGALVTTPGRIAVGNEVSF